MIKRRITALASAICMAFSVMTFVPSDNAVYAAKTTASQTESALPASSIKLTEKKVKALGRAYFRNNKVYCALPGSGIEFKFKGTKCQITLEGDNNSAKDKENLARFAIYVNGERVVDDVMNKSKKTYTVFKSKKSKTVDVKIVKLSESPMSVFAVSKVTVQAEKTSTVKKKEHYIEFIGDSITCGYGVDDNDKSHPFSTTTEDVTKTYAYLTAEKLDADYSFVSYSGYGIISGYSDGENKSEEQVVSKYYDKVGYTWGGMKGFTPQDIKWDFSKRQPDVVVINLGTNDASYTKGIEERCKEYQDGYVEFMKTIRKKNPNATIIAALGIMGQDLCPYVEAAVAQYTKETGDKNVSYLQFDVQSWNDGYGADWHPSPKTHKKAADKLTKKIKEVMGW